MLIGAGGLGLMCLTLHKVMGGQAAIVADIDPQKRGAAQGPPLPSTPVLPMR